MPHTATSDRLRRRLQRRGYEIFRTREAYPEERTLHHHDFYEVNLVWSGSMHYHIESRSYHLTNGDILLISPNELHQPDPETDLTACERVVLWIDKAFLQQFRSFGFDPTACFDTTDPRHGSCLRFDNESTLRIGELLERCLRENESGDFGAVMMADTIMLQVMILINRLHSSTALGEHRDRSQTLVTSVLDYINSYYAEELTLDNLANRFFISKYHLSREFGRIVGTSVHRYLIQKRLVVAKQLLSEGRPSSAVYQHCGFGDYSNFYRAFKAEYGISPKEYVANLREDAARNAERNRERSWLIREESI